MLFDACVKSDKSSLWDVLLYRLNERGLALVIANNPKPDLETKDAKIEAPRREPDVSSSKRRKTDPETSSDAKIGIIYAGREPYQQKLTPQQVAYLQKVKSILPLNAGPTSLLANFSIATSSFSTLPRSTEEIAPLSAGSSSAGASSSSSSSSTSSTTMDY
ncbi:MAG: hypothetical protein JSR33_11795 [Proteobacteria bacterium]|nr:hypothetical protein [Pseudomonadota bacterium]